MEDIRYMFLGVLFLLQATALPGYIFHQLMFGRRVQGIAEYFCIFTSSGLINVLMAQALVYFGQFNSASVRILIIVEVVLAIYYYGAVLLLRDPRKIIKHEVRRERDTQESFSANVTIENDSAIMMVPILSIFMICFLRSANPLISGDLGVYASWAYTIFMGTMPYPQDSMTYPLGMPLIWAIDYAVIGSGQVNFFNKIYLCLFPALVPLLEVLRWIATKDRRNLLVACIYAVLTISYMANQIGEWSMDLPCAAAGYVAYISYIASYSMIGRDRVAALAQVLLAASFSAVLKQSGLVIMLISVGWVASATIRMRPTRQQIGLILIASAIGLVPLFCSYGGAYYALITGQESSSSEWLTKGIHEGRGMIARMVYALSLLCMPLDRIPAFTLIMLSLVFGCFTNPRLRFVWLSVVAYFFYWAFYYSYERRTLAVIFPFVSLLAANLVLDERLIVLLNSSQLNLRLPPRLIALKNILFEVKIKLNGIRSLLIGYALAFLSVAVALLVIRGPIAGSYFVQTERANYMRLRGDYQLNNFLSDVKSRIGDGVVLSQYGINYAIYALNSIPLSQKSSSYLATMLMRDDVKLLIVEHNDAYGYLDDTKRYRLIDCLEKAGKLSVAYSSDRYMAYYVSGKYYQIDACG